MKKYHFIKFKDNNWFMFNPYNFNINYVNEEIKNNLVNETARKDYSLKKPEISDKLDVKALCICMTEGCNLRCKYCFADAGTYGDKRLKLIDIDILISSFENLLSYSTEGIKSICFFGGEPLLNYDTIEKFVLYYESNYQKKMNWGVITNGTLINERVVDFFEKHNVDITISLDGFKKYNDEMRFGYDNSSVYDKVISSIGLISGHKINLTCEATLAENYLLDYKRGGFKEYYEHFINIGFSAVFPFVADVSGGYSTELLEKIKMFYEDMVDYTFNKLATNNDIYGLPLSVIQIIQALASKKYAPNCSAGYKYIFLTTSGEIYPCQLYFNERKFKMSDNYKNIKISKSVSSKNGIKECEECYAEAMCFSWCPGSSLSANGDEKTVIPSRCQEQKTIAERTIYNLAIVSRNKEKWSKIVKNLMMYSEFYSKTRYE